METRRSRRRKLLEAPYVIELVSSDDEQEKKPKAVSKNDEVVELLSDGDDENAFLGTSLPSRLSGPLEEAGKLDGLSGISKASRRSISRASVARKNFRSLEEDNESSSNESGSGWRRRSRRNRKTSFQDADADEALARELQAEENRKHSSVRTKRKSPNHHDLDLKLAKKFQAEEVQRQKVQKKQEKTDAALAASIKSEEDKELDERKKQEIDSMKGSMAGRSVLLVEKVIRLVEALSKNNADLEPVGKDDAVFLAEKMLELQETFKKEGKPSHVCIGYHYTASANLDTIRTDGLLTVDDRVAAKNANTRNSAVFGNGLYTATNPLGFTSYGDVGLLTAVLKGKEQILVPRRGAPPTLDPDVNTVIGNKTGDSPFRDEVVLKNSSQALPLVKFKTANITNAHFADMVWNLHQQIQHQVLDEYFSESALPTTVNRVTKGTRLPAAVPSLIPASTTAAMNLAPPTPQQLGFAGMPLQIHIPAFIPAGWNGTGFGGPASQGLFGSLPTTTATSAVSVVASGRPRPIRRPIAPTSRRSTTLQETINYNAPESMVTSTNTPLLRPLVGGQIGNGDCSICMCPLADGTLVVEGKCNHTYHSVCIQSSLKHSVKCPECRQPLTNAVQGNCPSGTMTVTTSILDVAGFATCGSIAIRYQIPSGFQKPYHPNPGVKFAGDSRLAYLPNDQQGQSLLKRLKYAFSHGLTFTVGTSLTNRRPNVIVWGSIHHKTSMSGGVHGWPDLNYFANCGSELDAAGVPPASQL
jgi:deltex